MSNKSTTIAIGCLTQWYEIEIFEEYVNSLINALDNYEGTVYFDFCLYVPGHIKGMELTGLEECSLNSEDKDFLLEIETRWAELVNKVRTKNGYPKYHTLQEISRNTTISKYRRDFNTKYCEQADVLVWGETDMLLPRDAFNVINLIHTQIPNRPNQYIATFATCKMWDKTWEVLEHPEVVDKPFIDNDYENWWSYKYTMTQEEMDAINDRTEELDVRLITDLKFNGCGLIISSAIIKAGVNVPPAAFFVHEDTAFQNVLKQVFPKLHQYVIKNILLVHNRNHPKKRMYIKGETGDTMNKRRRSNPWYQLANDYSQLNAYNLFNPKYTFKTWDDVWSKIKE